MEENKTINSISWKKVHVGTTSRKNRDCITLEFTDFKGDIYQFDLENSDAKTLRKLLKGALLMRS